MGVKFHDRFEDGLHNFEASQRLDMNSKKNVIVRWPHDPTLVSSHQQVSVV